VKILLKLLFKFLLSDLHFFRFIFRVVVLFSLAVARNHNYWLSQVIFWHLAKVCGNENVLSLRAQ
jgi:hypothetical protein